VPGDCSPPATDASSVVVDRAEITRQRRTPPGLHLVVQHPPATGQDHLAVAPPPVVVTLAHPNGTRHRGHLNCGMKRPSRTRRLLRTRRASVLCPGPTPRSSLAWGHCVKSPDCQSLSSTQRHVRTSSRTSEGRTARFQILTVSQARPLRRWRRRWPVTGAARPYPYRPRTSRHSC